MHKNTLSLAIVTATLAGAISACQAGTIQFTEVAAPMTGEEKKAIIASPEALVDGVTAEIGYNTILRSGDQVGKGTFGQLVDVDGNNLYAEDGSPLISNDNDFSSLLTGRFGGLYMVSHFESRPGAVYLTALWQKRQTGELSALATRVIDFSGVAGGWVHCAGSVTPWGTHLGSEEYEPDARQWALGNIDPYNAAQAVYFGIDPEDIPAVQAGVNPYHYGYNIEVAVQSFRKVDVTKHYAMGRVAIELSYVMPDRKTVYTSDDGTNVGLYRFEADKAGDLSAGNLYAAVYKETDTSGMGRGDLDWIYLGHATDDEIKALIDDGITFTDIFDAVEPVNEVCPNGYTSINAGHGGADHQCLQLKPNMALAASRLETRRYAAMLGATTEWRKMEGITFNPDTHVMYLAMSEIDKGMLANNGAYDIGGNNHINLETKNKCGGVYALDLDSNYNATVIHGVISGIPWAEGDPGYVEGNTCNLDGLANPDNISYIPGYNTLIIGEDTGSGHQNDVIWAFDTTTDTSCCTATTEGLTRIQTTPYGAETTSPYVYPDINGFGYIMSVVQHPYGESNQTEPHSESEERGYTGFLGPFPALNK